MRLKTEAQRTAENLGQWHVKFALVPITLDDGNRIWWETYEEAELEDHSSGARYTRTATRVRDSEWMPWWAVRGVRPPARSRMPFI